MNRKLLALVAILCAASPALAAVTTNNVVYPQLPNAGKVQFLQGTDSAGTYKTIYTAGANGSFCEGLWITNSEASTTHLVTFQIVNGGVKYGGASITTVAGAGFTATQPGPQSVIGSATSGAVWTGLQIDANGNNFIQLVSGDTLQATFATAFVTSGAVINGKIACYDF